MNLVQNPRKTPSGRKVITGGREREEEKERQKCLNYGDHYNPHKSFKIINTFYLSI